MSVIIFDNNTDFLKAIDQLKEYVNSKDEFIYLTIQLNDSSDVKNEIEFLRKQHILTFNGYRTKRLIKVSLRSTYEFKANITYIFKRDSYYFYDMLHQNLRLMEWE